MSSTEQTRLYSLSRLPQDRLSRLSCHVLDRPADKLSNDAIIDSIIKWRRSQSEALRNSICSGVNQMRADDRWSGRILGETRPAIQVVYTSVVYTSSCIDEDLTAL